MFLDRGLRNIQTTTKNPSQFKTAVWHLGNALQSKECAVRTPSACILSTRCPGTVSKELPSLPCLSAAHFTQKEPSPMAKRGGAKRQCTSSFPSTTAFSPGSLCFAFHHPWDIASSFLAQCWAPPSHTSCAGSGCLPAAPLPETSASWDASSHTCYLFCHLKHSNLPSDGHGISS